MRNLFLAVCLAILAACSGTATGVAHAPNGEPLGKASMSYQERGVGGSGSITVTMPDGEVFKGSFAQGSALSSEVTTIAAGRGRVATGVGVGQSYGNDYGAGLISERGNSMTCGFQGDSRAGFGNCLVSDGRRVALTW